MVIQNMYLRTGYAVDGNLMSNVPSHYTIYEDESTCKANKQPETDDIADLDLYLNAKVLLPQDGEYMKAARVL